MHSPFTKIRYILTFASSSLEQFLRATWGAVSLAIVLTLPQIRLNSTLTVCIFCLSWQRLVSEVGWDDHQSFFPSLLPRLLLPPFTLPDLSHVCHFPQRAGSWQPVSLMLLNPSSRAWHTVRSSKPKGQSLERKMVYYWTKQGERVASVQRNPRWFSGKSF